jgi:hypothetical protein
MFCGDCKQNVPDSGFNRQAKSKSGFQNQCRDCQRVYKWKYRYGLDQSGYDEMLSSQNGRCKICRKTPQESITTHANLKWLCIDHCHRTGKVRGLLCNQCNVMIAHARESAETLHAAILYLMDEDIVCSTEKSVAERQPARLVPRTPVNILAP